MQDDVVIKVDQVEIIEDDFINAIEEAAAKFHYDDINTITQRQWKAVLKYVGDRIFKDKSILKSKELIVYNGNTIPSNSNRYDYNILNTLCDYYMYISDRYNKLISIEAFSLMLGLSREVVRLWSKHEPSTPTFAIHKKLKDNRLDCIMDNSFDNGNVTGTMYVGNVEYGTNLPGVREDSTRRAALTAADLPKLGGGNIGRLPDKEEQT